MPKRVVIDVISDVVCPWCYLGKRRLESALKLRSDIETEIHWRPYLLNPQVPREGMARVDYLSRKFGSDERFRPAHERLTRLGKEEGVEFHFERIVRQPNTLDAHRVIGWAEEAGKAAPVVENIMRAFFTEGKDLTNNEVLVEVAGQSGLDSEAVRRDLASDRDLELTQKAAAAAADGGISGVPFFIFNSRFALAGAQEPEQLVSALDQALAAEEVV
ncbi:MAG TPA: DsbA family oxidoreductase [Xanthobacteraceae bacterium]|nr:DsbA family oxidoreductase [Xanthobacteraceae bacterium]